MAQWVKRPTAAQVMISRFMSLTPESGSVLTARSLEPAGYSVSPSLSVFPPLVAHDKRENHLRGQTEVMTNFVRDSLNAGILSSKPEAGKLEPMGPIWPIICFSK